MKKSISTLLFYIGIPVVTFPLIGFILSYFLSDLKETITVTATVIQSIAILTGGLWAYHKFDWEKKAENAIKVKALLMEYRNHHNNAAGDYRIDKKEMNESEAYQKYALNLFPRRNIIVDNIHLSLYLPKTLRQKIFDTIWLSIGNAHGSNREHLFENWIKFEQQLDEINSELENIISV